MPSLQDKLEDNWTQTANMREDSVLNLTTKTLSYEAVLGDVDWGLVPVRRVRIVTHVYKGKSATSSCGEIVITALYFDCVYILPNVPLQLCVNHLMHFLYVGHCILY